MFFKLKGYLRIRNGYVNNIFGNVTENRLMFWHGVAEHREKEILSLTISK